MGIGKKLGQFAQWTGEKFGQSQKTETSEEFKRLQDETIVRKDCVERVATPLEGVQKQLTKTKEDPEDKVQRVLYDVLGHAMTHFADVLPSDSYYGATLQMVGQAHTQIAAANIQEGYLLCLTEDLAAHKEYARLETKLENRRLDFDAKLNKVQKSKKENTVLEEEARVCQAKYEETLETITQQMLNLSSKDDEHADKLLKLVEAELTYFTQCAQIMADLKEALSQYTFNLPRQTRPAPKAATQYRVPKSSSIGRVSSVNSSSNRLSDTEKKEPVSYISSNSTVGRGPPPPRPVSVNAIKQVKVLYDFDGETDQELSIRTGEIISVTEEIDSGWWIGTVVGSNRTGMFPSNYTEVLKNTPPPVRPRATSHTPSRDSTYRDSINDRNRTASNPLATAVASHVSRQVEATITAGACGTCNFQLTVGGCRDFVPHAFKAGQCNNCYHKH
ncbi:hypothetical protein HK103_000733 [Boothiomyces macroporosus]|uniref:BAR-domain-containing protein n=1 Tax=Boothiomyces macroporosus TaxID=261099 RepID=A0AAD5UFH7_9FUNG|nr:hypothetical protein HK103_000733 [Boothiomyces macroporosus]